MSVQFDIDASFEVVRSPNGVVRLRFITMAGEGSFTVPLTEGSRRWLLIELSRCAPPCDERLDGLDVFCPVCGGRPGVVCRDRSGNPTSHLERGDLARLVNRREEDGGAACTGTLVHDEFTPCPLHDARVNEPVQGGSHG